MKELLCDKCGKEMSVVKAIPKGTRLVAVSRCPSCKATKKSIFEYNDKSEWLDGISEAFLLCDLCGTANKDNYVSHTYLGANYGFSYRYSMSESKKVEFKCRNCGKRRVKVTTGDFWRDVESTLKEEAKKPAEPAPAPPDLTCPKCEKPIVKTDKICPNCGLELICDKCDAPLVPGSKFCMNCGDKVETFPVEKKPEPGGKVCPSCEDPIKEGQIYCERCGQEVRCDKCGADLIESASFCRECGDPVKMGDLGI